MIDTKPTPGAFAVKDIHSGSPVPLSPALTSRWRQRVNGKDGLRLLRTAVLLGLLGVVVVPIMATVVMGSRADFGALLSDPAVYDATRNSLVSSAVSALAATALGVGFAVIFERFRFPGQNFLRWFLLIPFLIPPFIGAMSWMALLGVNGPVNQLLSQLGMDHSFSIFGGTGVIFLLTVHSYPIAYLVISSAIRQVPGNLEEAARISGASNWTVLRTVTLPLIRPGITAAFMLAFVSSLSDFWDPSADRPTRTLYNADDVGIPATVLAVVHKSTARNIGHFHGADGRGPGGYPCTAWQIATHPDHSFSVGETLPIRGVRFVGDGPDLDMGDSGVDPAADRPCQPGAVAGTWYSVDVGEHHIRQHRHSGYFTNRSDWYPKLGHVGRWCCGHHRRTRPGRGTVVGAFQTPDQSEY